MSGSAPSTPSPPLLTTIPPFSSTSIPRLQALYSDFSRQKQSNPTSYHANVEWWRKALEVLVSSGKQSEDTATKSDRLVLNADQSLIERVKIPKVGKPLALGAVLSELRATKSAILLPEFLNAKTSIYNPGWLPTRIAAYVVGKPLWWALEHMGVVGEEGFLNSVTGGGSHSSGKQNQYRDTSWYGDYILVPLVERSADAVEESQRKRMTGKGDALYTLESFRAAFASVVGGDEPLLREMDAKVLVRYLDRDRGVVIVDNEVVKFVDINAPRDERVITAVDRGILELKTAIRNMYAQVDSLQSKIDECTKKASSALQHKHKTVALSYIRSRKQLEDLLQKRLGSLNTLESTFNTVDAAAGEIEIMKSYETSTATLKAILGHPSLQRSKIDETMEALAEASADAREIDNAIRIGGDIAVGVEDIVDDAELDEELKALVRDVEAAEREKEAAETSRKLAEAPITPDNVPVGEVASRVARPIAAT